MVVCERARLAVARAALRNGAVGSATYADSQSSQPGVYYPYGYIITWQVPLATLRPVTFGGKLASYMTSKSESRLGALRKA